MAKRHRVRASKARRRREREAELAKVAALMQRFNGRLTDPATIAEAENELLIHKARMAGKRRAALLRKAATRLAKSSTIRWLYKGQTPGKTTDLLAWSLTAFPPAPGEVARWSSRLAL